MPQQSEDHVSECNIESFSRGFRIWWWLEGQPYLKEVYSALVFGASLAVALSIFVHVFFPIGALLSTVLPVHTPMPSSLLAFKHSSDVVVGFTSLGVAPFVALAMFAIWVRHVCLMGKPNP
ncbi:TPA: hypothetical protein NIB55_005876 [Pseudomonas aeruginosa]|nr:hypothetical protein [Pseudomonas aeruginosa]